MTAAVLAAVYIFNGSKSAASNRIEDDSMITVECYPCVRCGIHIFLCSWFHAIIPASLGSRPCCPCFTWKETEARGSVGVGRTSWLAARSMLSVSVRHGLPVQSPHKDWPGPCCFFAQQDLLNRQADSPSWEQLEMSACFLSSPERMPCFFLESTCLPLSAGLGPRPSVRPCSFSPHSGLDLSSSQDLTSRSSPPGTQQSMGQTWTYLEWTCCQFSLCSASPKPTQHSDSCAVLSTVLSPGTCAAGHICLYR